jgi:DNA-binding response OmpR family regulator
LLASAEIRLGRSTPGAARGIPDFVMPGATCILVVGHGPTLEQDDGAAVLLRQLGAEVRTVDLWDDLGHALDREDMLVRAIVFEAGDRPDLAVASLRAARREVRLKDVPALIQLPTRQVARLEPSAGFDDFIVTPYDPAELYARIKALEWKRSEFSTEERLKVGDVVIDRAAHEVTLGGRRVTLTAKEFALLAYLATNRGRVFSREVLLARVWGARYEGGARTVDIHVRRLRAKLGDGLPLETMRGAGYKLRAPSTTGGDEGGGEASETKPAKDGRESRDARTAKGRISR